MKHLIFITSFLFSSLLFGQIDNISLSNKSIKNILKTKKNDLGELINESWTTKNDDSLYFSSDTIYFYNNYYMYLSENWCNEINWNLDNKNKITIIETILCHEPPISTISFEKSNLKFKIVFDNRSFFLFLNKGLNEYSKFEIISLEKIKIEGKNEYVKMTLVRKYELGIYMELPDLH
ncbi:MAG: hypothetical protein HYR91_01200 [Flavobacteriia bacterium]|nr:hypothetical protein [Flavobacteriia bacterium]